jgi:hypothetical protein
LGSPATGLGFDALTFLVSFVSLAVLRMPPKSRSAPAPRSQSAFWNDLRGGLDVLRPHPWLWQTILIFGVANIFTSGLLDVLVPWYVKVHLDLPAADYGFAMTGMAVGSLLMALLYGQRRRWTRRRMLAYIGGAGWALGMTAVALFHTIGPIIVVLGLSGAGIMLIGLVWEISLQEMVPQEYFGRVTSLDMLGSTALLPFGFIAVGAVANAVGGVLTLIVIGLTGAALMLAMLSTRAVRDYS